MWKSPGQGVESELQLLAYTTATATPDASRICDLHHGSWQGRILNPVSEARDQTRFLMDTSEVLNLLSHNGNSSGAVFLTAHRSEPSFFSQGSREGKDLHRII